MTQAVKSKQKIIYDETCGLCRGFRRVAEKRDRKSVFEFIPGKYVDPDDFSPHSVPTDLKNSLAVVDSDKRLYRGARAISRILQHLGYGWRVLGKVISWPIVADIADRCYRFVARHRNHLPQN